jgi:hypothetical protein
MFTTCALASDASIDRLYRSFTRKTQPGIRRVSRPTSMNTAVLTSGRQREIDGRDSASELFDVVRARPCRLR